MAFEAFPLPEDLFHFFEVEPELAGDTVITYKRVYAAETLFCSFSPDYGDIDLTLLSQDQPKVVLSLSYVQRVELMRDPQGEQLVVTFRPAMRLRNFTLRLKPSVSLRWGIKLDKSLSEEDDS